jgi:hypothetical protein
MKNVNKKSKITLEKLAQMAQNEFSAVRKEMATEFSAVRKEMATEFSAVRKEMATEFSAVRKEMATEFSAVRKEMATKEDLKLFATKAELADMKDTIIDEVRNENQKVIQSNDKVITKLDLLLKDKAAHDLLHKRIGDELHTHDKRIKKLEAAVKIS